MVFSSLFREKPLERSDKKIALCLYGRYNNRLAPNKSGDDGYKYIKENIISRVNEGNVDVFIHSWDLDNQEKIIKNYKPYLKKVFFETQRVFDKDVRDSINESIFESKSRESFRTVSNTLSFLYSRAQSIKLKKDFEENQNIKYDSCVVCRFDLGQIDKYNGFHNHQYKVSEIKFNPDADMAYIYSAMWDQLNAGYADQWFYSSSEKINILIDFYEKAFEYFQEDSSYIRALCSGWPDSNQDEEFSNEYFKSSEEKTKNLVKYEISDAINNHFLHKWFFIDMNLYNISKFV